MADDRKQLIAAVNNSYWFERAIANTTNAYSIGDVIGVMGQLEVGPAGGLRGNGGGTDRVINVIVDEATVPALRIWFFRRGGLTTFADGAPFLPVLNDLIKVAGFYDINSGDYHSYGTRRFAQARAVNMDYSCPDGILYYYVEARSATTFVGANKLYINFGHWPD